MIAGLAYDHHSDFEGHTYVDLLQDTAVQVPGFETKTVPLPETEFWFWLDEMAGFDNAEDSEHDNAVLLEHAPPLPPSPPTSLVYCLLLVARHRTPTAHRKQKQSI